MNFKNKSKLSYTFLRIVAKMMDVDKKTRHYGTDTLLYEGEIHMIKAIKENEGISVTGLSELLGVTKGAISQMITKLMKKDMIVKHYDPNNLSRLVLSLSAKGEIAYANHEKLHENYEALFTDILQGASDDNKEFLTQFLHQLEEKLDDEGGEIQ